MLPAGFLQINTPRPLLHPGPTCSLSRSSPTTWRASLPGDCPKPRTPLPWPGPRLPTAPRVVAGGLLTVPHTVPRTPDTASGDSAQVTEPGAQPWARPRLRSNAIRYIGAFLSRVLGSMSKARVPPSAPDQGPSLGAGPPWKSTALTYEPSHQMTILSRRIQPRVRYPGVQVG